jgi:hypothetical protein
MIRRLMIPVAGTIAALVVVLWAHEPRGPAPELAPFDMPDAPEHAEPKGEEAPEPQTFKLELQKDGSLLDLDEQDVFKSPAAFAERRGDARHTVVLSAGEGVPAEALDAVIEELQARFEVRKEAGTEAEPETFEIELQADGTFLDVTHGDSFSSVEELIEQLGDTRHTLLLSNGEGITEAALDEALAGLRDRFEVRKVYRAPEAPPGD